MKKVFMMILLLVSIGLQAQVWNEVRNTKLCPGSNGYGEALPNDYTVSTAKYPLLVFIHGLGEQGDGNTQLFRVFQHGPLAQVKWNNYNTPFVMIAPQFSIWPGADHVRQVIDSAIKKYRIDENRIYVTGLSMGGAATWDYAQRFPTRPAAILPTCGALGPNNTGAKGMADAKLPVLATHNTGDPTVPYSNSVGWVNAINSYGANPAAVLVPYNSTTHDSWSATYDLTRKQFSGKNWAEWLLQYSKGTVVPPPVDTPKPILIIPTDERYIKVMRGFAQTTTDIYGSPRTIAGTSFQAFYNAERWGVFNYAVPVSNGTYTVKFYFAELYWGEKGKRVFHVDVEDQRIFTDFDILASVPKFTALELSHQVTVNDGTMNINFVPVKDNPKITGIELIPGELRTTRIITRYEDSATNKVLAVDTTYKR